MCPCLGARRVIVDGGSGREQTVFATFGSRGACVGVDFSFTVLLFPQTFFFVQLRSSPCSGGCFSGFVFFPLNCWYAAHGAVPSVCTLASFVAGCALSRCGVLTGLLANGRPCFCPMRGMESLVWFQCVFRPGRLVLWLGGRFPVSRLFC